MRRRADLLPLLLLAPALFACKLLDKDETKPGAAGTPANTGTPLLPAAPTGPGASPGLQPGRSAVPTNAEWSSAPEITVRGSSALGCSTKALREWLRVSCSGKNNTGGTPTAVAVESGARSEMFTFASNNVTSLVMPFREGTDASASFSWTDKSHLFTSKWPRGAPQPTIYGEFSGGSGPGVRAPANKTCKAHTECGAGLFCTHDEQGKGPLTCGPAGAVQIVSCKTDADCKGNVAGPKCVGPTSGFVPTCQKK